MNIHRDRRSQSTKTNELLIKKAQKRQRGLEYSGGNNVFNRSTQNVTFLEMIKKIDSLNGVFLTAERDPIGPIQLLSTVPEKGGAGG